MPGWSSEIANEFVRLAADEGRPLDQIQLQKLVYIAHGWCLAISGQPLTGDRPEAWEFGPVYRRLAEALSSYGLEPVTREITNEEEMLPEAPASESIIPKLDDLERDVITRVYQDYKDFSGSQLSNLTRRGSTPWERIYAGGAGRFQDIPHELIRVQFVQLVTKHRN